MRIVIMGTGPFAVPSAQRILESSHDVPLVVTRPLTEPIPKKPPPRPIANWAADHNLPLFQPASINAPEAISQLRSVDADLFFVCDYGQILSNDCLAASRLGGINLHGSLLPRHRGAAPVQWTILSGDQQAGVTVIHMTPKLDAGPALSMRRLEILPDENAGQLEERLSEVGVDATVEAIDLLDRWDGVSAIGELQDRKLATKAPRFSKQDGQLDFRCSAAKLVLQVRACQPWPGTYADLSWPDGKSMRLLIRAARCIPQSGNSADQLGQVQSMTASQLNLNWSGSWQKMIAVKAFDGLFLVARVQPAGKREMDAAEFLRGHPLTPGVKFLLPETNSNFAK